MTKPILTDVIIQGGGPIGGTLALLLADSGIQVSVVDHLPLKALETLQEDHRGFALSQKSKKILEAAGLWPLLKKDAEPILKVLVSNGDRPFSLDFEHEAIQDPILFGFQNRGSEIGIPRGIMYSSYKTLEGIQNFAIHGLKGEEYIIGYLVDAYRLRQTTFKACYDHKNITWHPEASLEKIDSRTVTLSNGCILRASLVVGADGKNSSVRSLSHISVKQHDYNQSALVFTIDTPLSHDNIAFEKFLPTGPFAILPMTRNRKAIVWAMQPNAAQVLLDMEEDAFLEYLAPHLVTAAKDITLLTQRYCYPLTAQHAETYIKPRVALVGDAAHVIHPLAGQGLNLGFRDIECLAQVIAEARGLGLDMGSLTVLQGYSDQRRRDTLIMKHAMTGLNSLFSNDSVVLDKLRELGLRTFNKMPTLKRRILAAGSR